MEARSTPRRRMLDAGRLLATVGAIALLVSLFLDWYSFAFGGSGEGVSAWTVFEITDLLLALLALLVLYASLRGLFPATRLPALPDAAATAAALIALALVVLGLVNEPPAARDSSLEEGAWLAFAGAVLMALGALLRKSRISVVVTPRDPAPAAAAPASEPRRSETETQVLRHD